MHTRIKAIRDANHLTQDKFGKRIGSARNTIANYENGNRIPSNAVITSICREFNVNEDWLRNGEGEMFLPSDRDTLLADFTISLLKHSDEEFVKKFVGALSKLDVEHWELIANMAEALANKKE